MTPCLHLDDYLDGRLTEAESAAFEAHAIDCPRCDDALALPADVVSCLQDVTCPPDVFDQARRLARRAPDRAPARNHRRVVVWAPIGLALLAALAITISLQSDTDRQPQIASAEPPGIPDAPPAQTTPEPAPTGLPPEAADVPTRQTSPATRPSRSPAPRAASPIDPPPEPAPIAAASPDDLPAPLPPDDAAPTQDDIDAARRDLALAFQLVAEAQTRARDAVQDESVPLSTTLDHALAF